MRRFVSTLLRKFNAPSPVPPVGEVSTFPIQGPASVPPVCKGTQILLKSRYREVAEKNGGLPSFAEVEFRNFSENGEDGILLYLFSLIGTTNHRALEICAGDGRQCNTANLIIHHGWEGLLFDGDPRKVEFGRQFFAEHPDTKNWPPNFVQAWVTAGNVNKLVAEGGFAGNIDLLSLDIDGQDYWIWKALDAVSPRVVVLEYQDILGPDRCVTIPYDPNFVAEFGPHGPNYCGASLGAYVKLGREKGYRLIGCQRYGYNAFFLRNDVGLDFFPEIPIKDCFTHPKVRYGAENRYPKIAGEAWVEV